jgi:Mn2+/Fe2+ NRAMP family transporter
MAGARSLTKSPLSRMGPYIFGGAPMAILIIISWFSGYVSGPVITMQEFTTVDRCEHAADVLREQAVSWDISKRVRAFCVLK